MVLYLRWFKITINRRRARAAAVIQIDESISRLTGKFGEDEGRVMTAETK